MANHINNEKAPDMADLLQYFENRSRALDEEGQPSLDASTLQFMSLIRFNGVPILPPVLTEFRREEMMSYKVEAVKRETRIRSRRHEELQAKVQSIVAGVEERRAAKQASRSSSKNSSPASHSSRKSSRQKETPEKAPKTSPKLVVSSVNKAFEMVINNPATKAEPIKSSSRSSSTKSSPISATKSSPSPSKSSSIGSGDAKKRDNSMYRSLGKVGTLTKQKSYSSQHLDRVGASLDVNASSQSTGKTSSLSPKPSSLFPHPPVGRPPSRGGSMRQSSSTPDLRTIDMSVQAEDLRKPWPRRSMSPKGGRPQAPVKDESTPKLQRKNAKTDDSKLSSKSVVNSDGKKNGDKKTEPIIDKRKADIERKSNAEKKSSDTVAKKSENIVVKPKSPQSKSDSALQNPLELLEQELTKQEEHERYKRFENYKGKSQNEPVESRGELDPIQTATAELFPFPISEEQALATLDSLQSDFASLEQAECLPDDYNGIPLTSMKQKQIIHMLTKLSKALNMEDTLTSTIGTVVQADQYKNAKDQKSKSENWTDSRSVPNGASGMDYGYGHMVEGNESYSESASNITNESGAHSSSFQNTSGNSSHSRARMSPTPSSSILSSASSVSGSRSRMSPKSLKNTVHFHSLVTEISTSASQSYEDKISYRKLDITPKNSENFEDDHDVMENESRENPSGQVSASGSSVSSSRGMNLLSKVALSPSVDSTSGSQGDFNSNHPLHDNNNDGELNTSDKENEYMPPDEESPDEHYSSEGTRRGARGQQVWNVYTASLPPGPIGENHPAVMKSSGKSDITDTAMMKSGGRSDISDIVKELGKDSQDKVLQEKLMKTNVENDSQYYYGTASTDLGRYMHAKTADDSITSMQEEITRSYLFSQQGLKSQKDGVFEIVKPSINVFEGSEVDFDESAVHLQPVILNGVQNSLHENRSMLEDEEKIRSNLQRVLFEDSDSEVSEVSDNDDDDDKIKSVEDQFEKKETDGKDQHGDVVNGDIVENEHASKSDESGIIAAYEQWTDLSNDKNDVDIIPNEHIQRNENEFDDADQDESDGEKSVDEKTAEVHEISESENEDDLGHDDDNNVDEEESISEDEDNETGEKEQVHNESNENNGETDFEVVDIQEEIDEETELKKPFQELNYTENTQPAVQVNEIDEQENEAKADHIQKYLSQVHEHSLHHEEEEEDEGMLETEGGKSEDIMNSISGLIQTFTSTIQSMNHLSQEDLFKMQAEQFELIQKKMIEHQQAQLEELFVAQRREQMNLQKEMENYHTHITEKQMSIDLMTLPPTMVPQISDSLPQVTNAWQPPTYGQTPAVRQQNTSQASTMSSPPFPVRPVAAYQPANAAQNSNLGFASTYNTMPYPDTMAFIDPRGFMQANIDPRAGVGGVGMGMGLPMGFPQDPNLSCISHNTSYSTIPQFDPGMLRGNQGYKGQGAPGGMAPPQNQDMNSSQSTNPFIYPSSPSLLINPKDRDNTSEVSGFAQATPKQLVFSNQSTPVQTKAYKPIQHSPMKPVSSQRRKDRFSIPAKVFDPAMQPKFARVSAAVKGYLTRRLLRTQKVQDIVKTLDDTRQFAFSFQSETPIKKGTFTREDTLLLERIVNQLQSGLLDIHEIFFMIPVAERMAIIANQREQDQEKMLRHQGRHSLDSVSRSQPKLSKATLKAMERKKQAKIAEESVFGSMEFRTKSAPPSTSSPAMDIRALRPIQGQISPIHADHISVREMKERPKTAPENRKQDPNRAKKSSGSKSSRSSTGTSSNKQKSAGSQKQSSQPKQSATLGSQKHTNAQNMQKPTKKTDKAWR